MSRLTKRELDEIVDRDLPGYRVVQRSEPSEENAPQLEADQVAPDIEELREKYLGDDGDVGGEPDSHRAGAPSGRRSASGSRGTGVASNKDDEIIVVEPKNSDAPFDHPARPKTVVVSGKDGRVVGSQG